MAQEAVEYTPAPEVEAIAQQLIPRYHPHLLEGVRIDYCFVSRTPRTSNKEVWGSCRKVTGLHAHLAGDGSGDDSPFFAVTISRPVWDALNERQRVALVDHELCHAAVEEPDGGDDDAPEPPKLSIRPHDLEEFAEIVRRHGLWREDVQAFLAACGKDGGA